MNGADATLTGEDIQNMELALQSVYRTSPYSPSSSASRPNGPGRPNPTGPRPSSQEELHSYSLFQGELDPLYKDLLAWVGARCPEDGWEQLKSRSSEPGSPPWLRAESFGLDPLSHKVLALSLAHSICALGRVENRPLPNTEDLTASQAMYKLALLPPKGIHDLATVLAEESNLRRRGLIEVTENISPRPRRFEPNGMGVGRFFKTAFSLNVHALAQVLGLVHKNERQGPSIDQMALPEEVRTILDGPLSAPPGTGRCFTVYLKGPRQSGRRTLAHAIAMRMGLPLKQVRRFDSHQPGSALLVDVHDDFDNDDWATVQEHPGLAFLRLSNGDPPYDLEGNADLVLDLGDLNVGTLAVFVAKKLKEAGSIFSTCDPIEIARTGAQPGKVVEAIDRIAREAKWRNHTPEVVHQLLERTLRIAPGKGESSQFVEVVTPHLGLGDIHLPGMVRRRFSDLIRAIKGRETMLQNWGLDPSLVGRAQAICLFHGSSGTGKSMAAEVLAHELGMPLWRVAASELESAYVGESESRVNRFFKSARGRKAVLLLDEADSFLGDRSRAEGSTRRYSVSLVNQWLRELDQFEGILVFTSNLADGMDTALERRIQFRLEFPQPEAEVREQIWANLFSKARIPGCVGLDLKLIAHRFPLSGGRIRNAFLTACQKAAEVGEISQEVLVAAAEEEHASGLPGSFQARTRIRGFAGTGMNT